MVFLILDSPSFRLLAVASLLAPIYLFVKWLLSTRRPTAFPPGPTPVLGLGNIHQMPRARRFMAVDAWAKQYGPIMGLKFGPTNVVIINDSALIYREFVKRAAYFSARPPAYVAQEHVLGESRHIYSLFLSYEKNIVLRTLTKPFLVGTGLTGMVSLQKAAGSRLVYDMLQSGDKWMAHSMKWGISTPLAFLAGVPVDDLGLGWVSEYSDYLDLMEELVDPANAPPIDNFPILRLMPAAWKGKARKAKRALGSAYGAIVTEARKHQYSSFPSLIPRLLRQAQEGAKGEGPTSEEEIQNMMGGMLDAAVDSSVVSFQIIMLALATHPEAQRKAQQEIDEVLGTGESLPDKIDVDRLPYLNACVTETLRWRPTSVLGLPRQTVADEEDVIGYRIPKGTTVMLNQWSCQHDEDYYDEPHLYKPERFMAHPLGMAEKNFSASSARANQVQGRKALYTFGAGRRECPGKEFFFQGVRIALAQILWAFEIRPRQGEKLYTDVDTGFIDSVILRPKPFNLDFVPRRQGIPSVLAKEKQKADAMIREILA